MQCDCYAVFDKLICFMMWYAMIWFVENILGIYYVTVMIYDMCTIWIVMSKSIKTIWYELYVWWMIWYDWHEKWQLAWIQPRHTHKSYDKWYEKWYENVMIWRRH